MKKSTFRRSRISQWAAGAFVLTALFVQGCLQRPVKEQTPNTSDIFVSRIPNDTIKTIDMLFVIDNSVSMGDKQEILAVAVPKMVERLVSPNCVDMDDESIVVGKSVLQGEGTTPSCPAGSKLEFVPVSDIHLGVVSSSLVGHGAEGRCVTPYTDPMTGLIWYNDDKGHLIPTVRPGFDA